MKNKTLWIIIAIVILILIIGYFTNWFGLGKKTITTTTITPNGTSRVTGLRCVERDVYGNCTKFNV